MTTSTPFAEPAFRASDVPPVPPLDVMALQPQLQLVSGLLSRLIEQLEAFSGEASQQIAEVLSRLTTLTQILTACLARSCGSGEPAEHEVDDGERDEGFGRLEAAFVVLGQAARSAEPAEGALDHPPARLDSEALLPLGGSDDLNPDALLGGL